MSILEILSIAIIMLILLNTNEVHLSFCNYAIFTFISHYFYDLQMPRLTNNSTRMSKSLEISSWNVNGLFKIINNQKFSKRSNPDFVRQLNSDIIVLCETHTGTNEALQFNDYKCVTNCRYSDSSRLRGGLAVFIKHNTSKGVKIIDKCLSDMM